MKEIISLQQNLEGFWQAKYQGNYGVYKIKIKMLEGNISRFSCSCPSDYYPCKHIPIVAKAIQNQTTHTESFPDQEKDWIKNIFDTISFEDLKKFTVNYAQCNAEFASTFQLEFLHKMKKQSENNYATLLRKELNKIHFDLDDLYDYYDSNIEIDIIDDWLTKAKTHVEKKELCEAVAICKAIIEEYADWCYGIENDILEYIDAAYREEPFSILKLIACIDTDFAETLFNYCITESDKHKYKENDMDDDFHALLLQFANTPEQIDQTFALLDNCLKEISDKTSYSAQKIIERKIDLYQRLNQPEKAMQLLSENIQIELFRKKVVEDKIKRGKNSEAKQLINDFLSKTEKRDFYYHSDWNQLLLTIAQNEGDILTVRKLSFSFVENYFEVGHYQIYKSTFTKEEWPKQLQKILAHYKKNDHHFNTSAADVLVEEKDSKNLLSYVETYLSTTQMEKYYPYFVESYPVETLILFQKAINQYVEQHTGRSNYEYIYKLMVQMKKINGGKEMVKKMTDQYRLQYKNRRAMMEILNEI